MQRSTRKSAWQILLFAGALIFSPFIQVWGFSDSTKNKQAQTSVQSYSITRDTLQEYFKSYIPQIHDEDLIRDRLACIEREVALPYNSQIRKFIELYTIRKRESSKAILNRKDFYFPIFEAALRRHGMPEEIKYLSVVESALKVKAVSSASAVGLWQFMSYTGKEYGLNIDEYIDERMDIFKSTDAACRFLKYLYNRFGDWHLAMAAYNCGPGRVAGVVGRSGTKDFWSIYMALPAETRAYVPLYIAASYMVNFAEQHNLYAEDPMRPLAADSVLVNQQLYIETLGNELGIPFETMQLLNPHLKKNIVPSYLRNYPVYIPADKKPLLHKNRSQILYTAQFAPLRQPKFIEGNNVAPARTTQKHCIVHEVEKYQTLGMIALQYDVRETDILVWNRLLQKDLQAGQQLNIWTKR